MNADAASTLPFQIAFRVDASPIIGSGHLMRCLTLAQELSRRGHECHFICRSLPDQLARMIENAGHQLHHLPKNTSTTGDMKPNDEASWLGTPQSTDQEETAAICLKTGATLIVVDHYAIDTEWETPFRSSGMSLMVIDDLANRHHDCDLLLDQTFARETDAYGDLVPKDAMILTGSRYALLRPEFAETRETSLARRKQPTLNKILVSLGGTDEKNLAGQILDHLSKTDFPDPISLTMVLGSMSPHLAQVSKQADHAPFPVSVIGHTDQMATLLADTDLAIGAAGGSAWERCALGVPACTLVLAPNQIPNSQALENAGAAMVCENIDDLLAGKLAPGNPALSRTLGEMSAAAAAITDGNGTSKVADAIETLLKQGQSLQPTNQKIPTLRPMSDNDLEMVLEWRNHPATRAVMYTSHEISWAEHKAWYERSSTDENTRLLIFELDGDACGFVKFRQLHEGTNGDWGFYLAPDAPSGSGRHLGNEAVNHAFTVLGFKSLLAEVIEGNEKSLRFHRRLGFLETGKDTVKTGDGDVSICRFELTRADWQLHQTTQG